ncbi:MAG: transposase [Proteobacteria bacterium]|nr:transposase [Pseudomonadota bacterium]
MAIAVSEITLGIDVSKDELVICDWDTEQLTRLKNEAATIKAWLGTLYGPVRVAIEPTSHYHLEFTEQAHALGITVYLINPRQLVHYRKAVGERNKTDPADARLLARYLARESDSLRSFTPPCAKAQRLWALIKRRGVAVMARQKLQQSFRDIKLPAKALFRELQTVIARIDQQIQALIRELGWWADYQRCHSIPGIGPVNAAALVAVYHRGAFAGSDAYVAFIGLDIRVRESGKFKGQRKLTKCGEAEIRRLLFCAAEGARSYPPFDNYLQLQLAKGLSKIAAKVILARKLARIAFTLLNNQQAFKKQEIPYSQSP